MNPVFQLPLLIPAAIVALGLAAFSAWRGSATATTGQRFGLTALRIAGVGLILALLFNPGNWVRPASETVRPWVVLADVSHGVRQLFVVTKLDTVFPILDTVELALAKLNA